MSIDLVPSGDGFRVGLGWWSVLLDLTDGQLAAGIVAIAVIAIVVTLAIAVRQSKRSGNQKSPALRKEPSMDQGAFAPVPNPTAPVSSLDSAATSPL